MANRTRLHAVRALKGENAPLHGCGARTAHLYNSHCGRASGCNTQPGTTERTGLDCPFWVGLPPAVKYPMRPDVNFFRGTETRWHSFHLLSFLLWIAEIRHLQHQRENPLISLSTQHRLSQGPKMTMVWTISGCSEPSRHNEQCHRRTVA